MDEGHANLMADIALLGRDAADFQFHDFKNTEHATPKVELRKRLLEMADRVIEGHYDN